MLASKRRLTKLRDLTPWKNVSSWHKPGVLSMKTLLTQLVKALIFVRLYKTGTSVWYGMCAIFQNDTNVEELRAKLERQRTTSHDSSTSQAEFQTKL